MNIEHVVMFASNFEETKHFYTKQLEIPLITEETKAFTLLFGETTVTFEKAPKDEQPFYHFALNVPANQFDEAKKWAKERVELLLEDSEDEVYFQTINAKSLYFEDPAGNIVEFICRLSHSDESKKPFSASSLTKMPEMSIVVPDKQNALPALHNININERSNNAVEFDGLSFMGEIKDATYLLFVNEGRRWFFSQKQSKTYPLKIQLTNGATIWIDEQLQLNTKN